MTTGAEHGEIAEVGSPVLVAGAPIDWHAPLRWTALTLAVASAFLALADAPTIGGWLDELPPGRVVTALRPVAAEWEALTAGVDAPRRWLRLRWREVRALRFGDEQPGAAGAADAP